MGHFVRALMILTMIWLPLSQAAGLCCPEDHHADNKSAYDEKLAEAEMPPCHGHETVTSGAPTADADACLAACLALAHASLPAIAGLPAGLDPSRDHNAINSPASVMPGFSSQPLRPPA